MSLQGMIQRRGSTVTIRRSSTSESSDGTFNKHWVDVTVGTKALIESLTSELSQRIWGQEITASHRAYMAQHADVKEGDAIIVTAGSKALQKFRIAEVLERDMNAASRYLEIGLHSTTEAFE